MEFSEKLKSARLNAKMTRDELACDVDVVSHSIGGYERGRVVPSLERIMDLATALKVKPVELLPDWFLEG